MFHRFDRCFQIYIIIKSTDFLQTGSLHLTRLVIKTSHKFLRDDSETFARSSFQPFGHFNVSIHICDTFTGSILCNPCNRTFNQLRQIIHLQTHFCFCQGSSGAGRSPYKTFYIGKIFFLSIRS